MYIIYREDNKISEVYRNSLVRQGISPYWYILDDYCSFLIKIGGNPQNEQDRIAFIEKSARVYNKKINEWETIFRGTGGDLSIEGNTIYGFYEPSRVAVLDYLTQ